MEPTVGDAMSLLERWRGKKTEQRPHMPDAPPAEQGGVGEGLAGGETLLMPIEDVFTITGRGTVVTGRISRGAVRPGDPVELVRDHDRRIPAVVDEIQTFRKLLDVAHAGDSVGVVLGDVDRAAVQAGMVLVAAGSNAAPPAAAALSVEVEEEVGPPEAQDEAPPATQVETSYARYPGSGVCDVCSRDIGPNQAFQVPTAEFWASRKYREWITTSPVTGGMLRMAGVSVDDYIAMQRGRDMTLYSAVCPRCIHLFP